MPLERARSQPILPALEIASAIDLHRTTVVPAPHHHDPTSGGRLQGRSFDCQRVQRVCSTRHGYRTQGTHTGYVSIVTNAYTRYPGRVASSVRLGHAGICMERRCAASKTPLFVKKPLSPRNVGSPGAPAICCARSQGVASHHCY